MGRGAVALISWFGVVVKNIIDGVPKNPKKSKVTLWWRECVHGHSRREALWWRMTLWWREWVHGHSRREALW